MNGVYISGLYEAAAAAPIGGAVGAAETLSQYSLLPSERARLNRDLPLLIDEVKKIDSETTPKLADLNSQLETLQDQRASTFNSRVKRSLDAQISGITKQISDIESNAKYGLDKATATLGRGLTADQFQVEHQILKTRDLYQPQIDSAQATINAYNDITASGQRLSSRQRKNLASAQNSLNVATQAQKSAIDTQLLRLQGIDFDAEFQARQFFANLGFPNPTADEIAKYVKEGAEAVIESPIDAGVGTGAGTDIGAGTDAGTGTGTGTDTGAGTDTGTDTGVTPQPVIDPDLQKIMDMAVKKIGF
jgi:hypothetical protein